MKTSALAAIALLAATGFAISGEMEGTIKQVDKDKHMIMLDDGMSVMTNKDVKLDGLMAGDKVKITTDHNKMGTMIDKM